MKRLMGLIVSLALLAGMLAGCAGAPAENSGTSTPKGTPATTGTSTSEASGDGADAVWPRTYVDATGAEVVIEKQPERVAVLHFADIQWTYALGTVPIAAALAEDTINVWSILEPLRNADVIDLGEVMSPNLEKLVEVEPDLIIGTFSLQSGVWGELSKIAPVVELKSPDPYTFEDMLREYGKVLGKEAEAEEYIAEVVAKVADARRQLSTLDETVIVLRGMTDGKSGGINGKNSPNFYSTDAGLGLKAPDNLSDAWAQITLEGIVELKPDHIFLMEFTDEEYQQSITQLSKSSVWNSLEAVKNGRVYRLAVDLYAGGPIGLSMWADYAVDTLLK